MKMGTTFGHATNRYMSSNALELGGVYASDLFVLQMSYDTNANVPTGFPYYIGWWDASLNQWVNAIAGNSTPGSPFGDGAYMGSYACTGSIKTLGAFGYDPVKNQAWAVLDHNGQYAVIPEPGTWAMFVGGLGVLGFAQRLRRRSNACF